MPGRSDPRDRERVIVRLRGSARAAFWPVVLLVAIAGALPVALGLLPAEWMRIGAAALAALLLVVGVALPLLRWRTRVGVITTRRVIARTGLLLHRRTELPHARGYGVELRRSGLQHLLRTADVLVRAGDEPPVELRDLVRPQLVVDALHELAAAARPVDRVGGPAEEPGARRAT